METYKDMLERHEKEFEQLPIFFAYTNEKFKRELEKRGATEDDVYRAGTGCFYLKSDADLIQNAVERFDAEFEKAMQNDDFMYGAFYYELANHEFFITGDPIDALDALHLTIKEVENDERMSRIFKLAKKTYLLMEAKRNEN